MAQGAVLAVRTQALEKVGRGQGPSAEFLLSSPSPGVSRDPRSDTVIPCVCRFVSLQMY